MEWANLVESAACMYMGFLCNTRGSTTQDWQSPMKKKCVTEWVSVCSWRPRRFLPYWLIKLDQSSSSFRSFDSSCASRANKIEASTQNLRAALTLSIVLDANPFSSRPTAENLLRAPEVYTYINLNRGEEKYMRLVGTIQYKNRSGNSSAHKMQHPRSLMLAALVLVAATSCALAVSRINLIFANLHAWVVVVNQNSSAHPFPWRLRCKSWPTRASCAPRSAQCGFLLCLRATILVCD